PEPAGRLVTRPLRVAVLKEPLEWVDRDLVRVRTDLVRRLLGCPLNELDDRGPADRLAVRSGPRLADHPGGAAAYGRRAVALVEQRRLVVPAQVQQGRQQEPGPRGHRGGYRGDDPADERAGEGADREGG